MKSFSKEDENAADFYFCGVLSSGQKIGKAAFFSSAY
jgi:hypothetical protein